MMGAIFGKLLQKHKCILSGEWQSHKTLPSSCPNAQSNVVRSFAKFLLDSKKKTLLTNSGDSSDPHNATKQNW